MMGKLDQLLKYMNSPKGKKELKKWFHDFLKNDKADRKTTAKMMSSFDYIEWLEFFTRDKEGFSTITWLYLPDQISVFDNEHVDKLNLFYEGIYQYANQNNIKPTFCDFGNYYLIKCDNVGFEIGFLTGQGGLFYCKRIKITDDLDFIDFADIVSSNKNKS